jgi:hypothetical protein
MLGSILGAVAGPLIGGLLGGSSSKKGTTTTSENKLDPRMDRYVYGADGQSGLLGSAFNLAQEQMKNGGLNDLQRQGLDMQRQYLMSPQYQQGFSGMMGLGQSLMGGGVAGNPFTKGQGGGVAGNPFAGSPFSYSGEQNATLPSYTSQPSLTAPPSPAPTTGLLGGGGPREQGGQGGRTDGGYNSTSPASSGFADPNDGNNPMGTTFSDANVKSVAMLAAAVLGIPTSLAGAVAVKANQMFGTVTVDGMAAAMAQMDAQAAENDGIAASYGGGFGGDPNGPGGVNSDGNSYGGSWGASYGGAFNGGGGGGFGNGKGFGGSGGFGADGKGFGGNGSLGD